MTVPLSVLANISLLKSNTFGIDAHAYRCAEIHTPEMLHKVGNDPALRMLPRLILGGGSNLLFTRDFAGLVLHMCIKGMRIIAADDDFTYVQAAAGENWHGFVQWTLQHSLGGLENLSLIPGSVGAAPIQNIGAYGAEIKDYLHAVTVFDFATGDTMTLDRQACAFGYRDSIFKHALRDRVAILDVTFALPKRWQPNLRYADVAQELTVRGIVAPTAADISAAVVAIRSRKLPDPARLGNAGSFFKNPVVSRTVRDALTSRFPQLVSYAQPDGSFKLAAGWLIEQCGWKGRQMGAAGVYHQQALVLVNHGGATGQDIVRLATAIQADVHARFGVQLEPEPVFV